MISASGNWGSIGDPHSFLPWWLKIICLIRFSISWKKEYTYIEELELIELYEIYLNLTLLDLGSVSVALAVDILKEN